MQACTGVAESLHSARWGSLGPLMSAVQPQLQPAPDISFLTSGNVFAFEQGAGGTLIQVRSESGAQRQTWTLFGSRSASTCALAKSIKEKLENTSMHSVSVLQQKSPLTHRLVILRQLHCVASR